MKERPEKEKVRLDKWLWAARFFKTRTLAAEAVGGGKVELNGERPKPAKGIQVGDRLSIRLGPYDHGIVILALSERRGPASVAATLYEETAESKLTRERLAAQLKMAPASFVYDEKGRPTKKDRRELSSFIDRNRPGGDE